MELFDSSIEDRFGGTNLKKRLALLLMLTVLSVFLAGCSEFNEPIYDTVKDFGINLLFGH